MALVYLKVILSRSSGWLNLANAGMIVYVMLSQMAATHILPYVYVIALVGLIIFGLIDRRYFYGKEMYLGWMKFDQWTELVRDVKEIKADLKQMKEQK